MAVRGESYSGEDAFEEACQREHQGLMPGPSSGTLLDEVEAKVVAGHSLSADGLEAKHKRTTTPDVERQLGSVRKLIADGMVQQTGKVNLHEKAAELQEVLKRRRTSKNWLAQVRSSSCHQRLQGWSLALLIILSLSNILSLMSVVFAFPLWLL